MGLIISVPRLVRSLVTMVLHNLLELTNFCLVHSVVVNLILLPLSAAYQSDWMLVIIGHASVENYRVLAIDYRLRLDCCARCHLLVLVIASRRVCDDCQVGWLRR